MNYVTIIQMAFIVFHFKYTVKLYIYFNEAHFYMQILRSQNSYWVWRNSFEQFSNFIQNRYFQGGMNYSSSSLVNKKCLHTVEDKNNLAGRCLFTLNKRRHEHWAGWVRISQFEEQKARPLSRVQGSLCNIFEISG